MEQCKQDYELHNEVAEDIKKTNDESWIYVEKRLYAIASGALALSITLLTTTIDTAKSVPYKWLIIISWICLVLTILINFASHIVSYIVSRQTQEDIYKKMEQNIAYNAKEIDTTIRERNRKVEYLNFASIVFLTLGIIGIVCYFILQLIIY